MPASGRAPRRPPVRRPRSVRRGTSPSPKRLELDDVFRRDVFQASKEPVAVPGDSGVAIRPRQCRVFDVTDGAVEREVVGALQDGHFEMDLRDAQHRERRRCRFARGLPPGGDALQIPEAQVWRGGLPAARPPEGPRSGRARSGRPTPSMFSAPHATRHTTPNVHAARSAESHTDR